MLRAGPLSDELTVRLINRRFVPFAFDLSDRGFLGDPEARAFVTKAAKEYAGRAVSTPKLLIMTPAGEVIGTVSNYGSITEMRAALLAALRARPEFNKPAPAEAEYSPYEKAELALDLLRYDDVYTALKNVDSARAWYLRGRVKRFRGQWREMRADFANVKGDEFRDHVAMDGAHEFWATGKFDALAKTATSIRKSSARYAEARYFLGLAHFHRGETKKAQAVWSEAVRSLPQGPWAYRADWALCESKRKAGRGTVMMSSSRKSNSELGRIGYMGRRHPDLRPRAKSKIER